MGFRYPTDDFSSDLKMEFRHRHNDDGTYDSICLFCFQTIGTSIRESGLYGLEFRHSSECWKRKPVRVDQVEDPED